LNLVDKYGFTPLGYANSSILKDMDLSNGIAYIKINDQDNI